MIVIMRINCYVCPLDDALGIHKYERIGEYIRVKLMTEATEVSYAKSAQIVTGGMVSRQSVRNHLLKLNVPEKEADWEEKKVARELHVYADEDHVHMQKPRKPAGKKEAKGGQYSQYAERLLREAVEGCFDWSIFEKVNVPFDGASGT